MARIAAWPVIFLGAISWRWARCNPSPPRPHFDPVPGWFFRIDVEPQAVHIQLFHGPPAESFERSTIGRNFGIFRTAFRIVPAHAAAALARREFVVGPQALGKTFSEMVHKFPIQPKRLLAVRITRLVHLDHLLHANPFPFSDLEVGIVDEAIPPGLSARRAAAHLTPIRVIIPRPGFPKRLDAGPK
jgi:hypothetical protein